MSQMKSLSQTMIQREVPHLLTDLYSLMRHQDSFLVQFKQLAETQLGTQHACHACFLTVFYHVTVYGLESLSYGYDASPLHAPRIGA